jgi:ribose transport system ATP-binding protein
MLTLTQISKSFPGVKALEDVGFDVRAGEIHALAGENGAGKSTLTRLIAGVHKPDAGKIEFLGKTVEWSSPRDAKAQGIHVIYQEFVLFPQLTVAENIFIGHERRNRLGLIDYRQTRADALKVLSRLGVNIDPDAKVSELPVADQQMIEIAKALVYDVRLLILDEPTAVISGHEVELLFERLHALKAAGVAIVYISHRLEEIFQHCDRVTVLKDGRHIATRAVSDLNRDELIALMVGRDMRELFPPRGPQPAQSRKVVLKAENIRVPGRVYGAGLELQAGEITGLAGMVGSGRTELAMAIFGALPMGGGTVSIEDRTYRSLTPRQAIDLGIGLVTEDRKSQGLAMLLDVAANVSASALGDISRHGLLDRAREAGIAAEAIVSYKIACRGPSTPVALMSGGNQQKVIVARWARTCTRVLILDEPTRGVDVGAKMEIYRIIQQLAAKGLAILMISSELPEVVAMSDRVVVMREGVISGTLEGEQITEAAIVGLATQRRAA